MVSYFPPNPVTVQLGTEGRYLVSVRWFTDPTMNDNPYVEMNASVDVSEEQLARAIRQAAEYDGWQDPFLKFRKGPVQERGA